MTTKMSRKSIDISKRDIQFSQNDKGTPLKSEFHFPFSFTGTQSKRKRRTIHGDEIRKENVICPTTECVNKKSKVKRSNSSGNLSKSTALVTPSRNANLSSLVKGTIKRRVSTSLLKHKLKKFQDYSLPYQHGKLALLQETCNVSSPTKLKATPPPKPPRQKPPRNTRTIKASPVWVKQKAFQVRLILF
uniref:Uncharacterized protein n=1 Tax=Biomphalaria glabrata TaxID=6526 RepID=A0A2C9KX75_BIOGL